VGGNYQFDDIYGHAADFTTMQDSDQHARRSSSQPPIALHAVQDGYQFDLGGRTLEVIEVPGHTRGSISLLDTGNRLLFTGDNPNQFSWVFLADSAPVEGYLQTLQKLERRASEYDTVLPGHGSPIDSAIIAEQAACAQSILDGSCAATPYSHYFATQTTMLCSYKRATIAYDSTRLWLNK
jgi:glyoxylase-like metal-dependent hydrolase (beta-lactamase superfamily II)